MATAPDWRIRPFMTVDWTTSPPARRVLQHEADKRPAWLWSQDGLTLLWQNRAAGLFLAKLKKHGLKLAPPAVPIKGQVARNIRLGSPGRTSLARIQFLAGEKPTSSTCATTPLGWEDGQSVLLIVGVDPIADEILDAAADDRDVKAAPVAPADAVEPVAEPPVTETSDGFDDDHEIVDPPTPVVGTVKFAAAGEATVTAARSLAATVAGSNAGAFSCVSFTTSVVVATPLYRR